MKFVLPETLPPEPEFENGIRRAPDRGLKLSKPEIHVGSIYYDYDLYFLCFKRCYFMYENKSWHWKML